jgi:uncharacterized protein (DUF58 family)
MREIYDEIPSSIFLVWPSLAILLFGLSFGLIFRIEELVFFSVVLLWAGFLSLLWSTRSLDRVDFSHTLDRHRAFPEERLEVRLCIDNRKRLPVLLAGKIPVPESLSGEGTPGLIRERIFFGRERASFTLSLFPHKRGVYTFGPPELAGGDVFGFRYRHRTFGKREEIIVYPRPARIKDVGAHRKEYFGDTVGKSPVVDPLLIQGCRDYQPGNPVKNIHWKLSAKHDRMREKMYDPVCRDKVLLILDVTDFETESDNEGEIDFREIGASQASQPFERSLEVLTSIVIALRRSGTEVGFVTNGLFRGQPLSRITVSRTTYTDELILEELARVEPAYRVRMREILPSMGPLPAGIRCIYCAARSTDQVRSASQFFSARHTHVSFLLSELDSESEVPKNTVSIQNLLLPEEAV